MSVMVRSLLPEGVETTFAEIEKTMARVGTGGRSVAAARTATVVIVGPKARLIEVAESLESGGSVTGIRSIFIASGTLCTPSVRAASAIALDGLRGEFIDNAVAALEAAEPPYGALVAREKRERLRSLAKLVDRVVLDVEDPQPLWTQIDALAAEGPVGDLRWTALTRWRVLMAHFFEMPEVQGRRPGSGGCGSWAAIVIPPGCSAPGSRRR